MKKINLETINLSGISGGGSGGDMTNYYTKSEVDAKIAADTSTFVTAADVSTMIAASVPDTSAFATKEQVENMEYVLATAIADLYAKIGAAEEALSQI